MKTSSPLTGGLDMGIIRAEDGTESVAIVDIVVIDVRTGITAGYPRIIVVVLLRKPLSRYCSSSRPILAEVRYGLFHISWKPAPQGTGL
jgi:hypothetical protein